jgi:hypothetical protein
LSRNLISGFMLAMRSLKSFRATRGYLRQAAILALALVSGSFATLLAQNSATTGLSASDPTAHVRGVVVNSVTREPISRAVVFSGDNAFATMTDDRGRF